MKKHDILMNIIIILGIICLSISCMLASGVSKKNVDKSEEEYSTEYLALRFANFCFEYELFTPSHRDWVYFLTDKKTDHIHEYDFVVERENKWEDFIQPYIDRDTIAPVELADSMRRILQYYTSYPWEERRIRKQNTKK